MESSLQKRLRERRENQELERIRSGLAGLWTGSTACGADIPAPIHEEISRFWKMTTEPTATLACTSSREAMADWAEGLVREALFAGSVWVATHLDVCPWLECRINRPGWFRTVQEAVHDPWLLVNDSRDMVAAVTEEEYFFHFHLGRVAG